MSSNQGQSIKNPRSGRGGLYRPAPGRNPGRDPRTTLQRSFTDPTALNQNTPVSSAGTRGCGEARSNNRSASEQLPPTPASTEQPAKKKPIVSPIHELLIDGDDLPLRIPGRRIKAHLRGHRRSRILTIAVGYTNVSFPIMSLDYWTANSVEGRNRVKVGFSLMKGVAPVTVNGMEGVWGSELHKTFKALGSEGLEGKLVEVTVDKSEEVEEWMS